MTYQAEVAVYSEIHIKHWKLSEYDVEVFYVNPVGK
jgi:hypothetical protein